MMMELKRFTIAPMSGQYLAVVTEFNLPGVRYNGQHLQLKGYILAEARIEDSGEVTITFFHPDTLPSTGHFSLRYQPGRHTNGHSPLEPSIYGQEVWLAELDGEKQYLWPTGIESLLKTIEAAENSLAAMFPSFKPQLWNWLASGHHRPEPEALTGQALRTALHVDPAVDWPERRRKLVTSIPGESGFTVLPETPTVAPAVAPAPSGPGIPGTAFRPCEEKDGDNQDWFRRDSISNYPLG
jgi:hypothetical protein